MPDVIVHAYYTPAVNGMTAELVRDGALGIEGRISVRRTGPIAQHI